MKLNNKGISLIELLVSIILVGIVLIFLFQLIVDLKNETENNDFAYSNQVNRTELIYTIQNDLKDYVLLGIEDVSAEDLEVRFHFKGTGKSKISILTSSYTTELNTLNEEEKKYYLTYESVSKEKYTWELKNAAINPCGTFDYYINTISNNYYIKMNLYVYNNVYHSRNNPSRNNVIDDIEITFADKKENLDTTISNYLTNSDKGEKRFGSCDTHNYIEHLIMEK